MPHRSTFVTADPSLPEGQTPVTVTGDATTEQTAISPNDNQHSLRNDSLSLSAVPGNSAVEEQGALPLIQRFCTALDEADILYCHWKSNAALDRSASGLNDLDLLISRQARQRFSALVAQLGFKETVHQGEAYLPGVVSYYGFDATTQRLVHIHAHYQLVLGHDRTKNYRIPTEDAYLASRTKVGLFYAPSAEFEFVIFVLRMMLKFGTWDALLGRQNRLPKAARGELAYLLKRIAWPEVHRILHAHLPTLSPALFEQCAAAIQHKLTLATALGAGRRLTQALEPYTRHAAGPDLFLKVWRRAENAYRRRIWGQTQKAKMSGGGTMIALVGGDGAGKSTAIAGLQRWLAKDFATRRVHFGKPPRALSTRLVRGAVRLTRFTSKRFTLPKIVNATAISAERQESSADQVVDYGQLLLHVCTARDRYRTYVRARRFVNNGGIVITDRFPLPQLQHMEAPQLAQRIGNQTRQPLLRWLLAKERAYYARFQEPELLAILRLDPAVAVSRKPEEPAELVYRRSMEIWQADWSGSRAQLIDAAQPQEEVLATLKELVWSHL